MERLHFTVFALVLVLFAAIPSSVEAGAKKAVEACMQQTGATKSDFEIFMKSGEASQQFKCALSCSLQAAKFMKPDGTFDTSYTKSHLPAMVSGLIDTCASKAQPESDVCQRAYVYLACFTKAEPKVFIEFTTSD